MDTSTEVRDRPTLSNVPAVCRVPNSDEFSARDYRGESARSHNRPTRAQFPRIEQLL
jgi:hypothetical protein